MATGAEGDRRLGVALSGGGHRAACWSAGAVLGLVDAGVGDRIVSISSVSGGSITNGMLAAGDPAWRTDRAALESALAPGLHQWARDGLFFHGPATDTWVGATLGLVVAAVGGLLAAVAASIAAGRGVATSTAAWIATGIAVVLLLAAVLITRKVKAPSRMAALVLLGAVVAWPLTFGAVLLATASGWWLLLVWPAAVLLLLAAAKRFGARSAAVVTALDRTMFEGRTLQDLADRQIHHVFCATNLRTGNNLYLTNRAVWGFGHITKPAGDTPLAAAVQASACLPGAFLARTIDDIAGPGTGTVVLSDGGAYDNMADQWEWGFANRRRYAKEEGPEQEALLAVAQPEAADHLVVVNASRGMGGESTLVIKPGFKGEVASALGAKDVLYDVSTTTRRRLLIEMFDRERKAPSGGHTGLLVHIGTSPYELAGFSGTDPVAKRSAEAAAVLDRLTDAESGGTTPTPEDRRNWWKAVANRNSGVGTTLGALDPKAAGSTAELLHHAWVLTRIGTYVLSGWGTLPEPEEDLTDWRRARFDALVAQGGGGS